MFVESPSISRSRTFPRIIVLLFLLSVMSVYVAHAQQSVDRWVVGLRGGVNRLHSDFNDSKVGPGLDLTARYGISPHFSVGGTVGFEVFKTHLDPPDPQLPYDYLNIRAFPFSLIGMYHVTPGQTVSPYVLAGAGVMFYQRTDFQGNDIPYRQVNTSIHIPFGAGVEIFPSSKLSIDVGIGYSLLDDKIETIENGGSESYASLKAGLNVFLGESAQDDDDKDGLTNGEEATLGTNPENPDTDGDKLKDGDEVKRYGSSPLLVDTDGDGVPDYEEIFEWKSNPSKEDSDNDGLSDGEEKKLGTNPINPDSDGDLLLDGEEAAAGSNPLAVDTDADGLSDYDELRTYKTQVADPDSDHDGLSDGDEVNKTKTDPLKADTDGGGVEDGHENAEGSNPLDPTDDARVKGTIIAPGQPLVLTGVTFDSGSDQITRGSETALENAFIKLVLLPSSVQIDIIGYTDNVGSPEKNDELSQARAEAVRKWLVDHGIPATRLRAIGQGSKNPVASNDTEAGRALNRRIELQFREQPEP